MFLERIIFLLLTVFNIRELIIDAIPVNMKYAVSTGISLFIVDNPATLVSLTHDLGNASVIICLVGIAVSGGICSLNIEGAILIGFFNFNNSRNSFGSSLNA